MSLKLNINKITLSREVALKLARELKKVLQSDVNKEYGIYLLTNKEGKVAFKVHEDIGYGKLGEIESLSIVPSISWLTYQSKGVTTQKQLEDIIYKEGNKNLKEKYVGDVRQNIMDNYFYPWASEGKRQKDIAVYLYATVKANGKNFKETIYRGSLNDDVFVSLHNWVDEELDNLLETEDVSVVYMGDDSVRQEVADGVTKMAVAEIENFGYITIELGVENNGTFKRLELY